MKTFMARHSNLHELIALAELGVSEVAGWRELLIHAYGDFAWELPSTSEWRSDKIDLIVQRNNYLLRYGKLFDLNDLEAQLIGFLGLAHSVGCLHEELHQPPGIRRPRPHGPASAEIVEKIVGRAFATTDLGKIMLAAITHHTYSETPTPSLMGYSQPALTLAQLMRDFDIMDLFDEVQCGLENPGYLHTYLLTYDTVHSKVNPTHATRKGRIVPESILDLFQLRKAIKVEECESREAITLQILSQLFAINTPEMWPVIVGRHGPRLVFLRLLEALRLDAPDQHRKLTTWGAEWRDGVLFKKT